MSHEPDAGALATSIDGRHFAYEVPVNRLGLRVGGFVVIEKGRSGGRLGYVTGVSPAAHDRRIARVDGRVLEGDDEPFGDAATRLAAAGEVARWLDGTRPARAVLDVGRLAFAEGVPLGLDAGAFDRHTFLCGQSGSGKTYALGTVLERLLAETSLRIVVLDPNSDFVGLGRLREDVGAEAAARYAAVPDRVDVRRAASAAGNRLHVRFRDFDADERAAVLHLDPIADRDEYAALSESLEGPVFAGTVAET